MPRKPSCVCGSCPKCKARDRARARYQAMSEDERRAWVARRDPEKVKAADRARYYRDYGKRRAYIAAYQRANPEGIRAARERWVQRNPHKRKAQNALTNAVRDGKVVKGPCEVCGSTSHIHGHHDDYSRPLEVRWLCPKHHAAHHRELRARS